MPLMQSGRCRSCVALQAPLGTLSTLGSCSSHVLGCPYEETIIVSSFIPLRIHGSYESLVVYRGLFPRTGSDIDPDGTFVVYLCSSSRSGPRRMNFSTHSSSSAVVEEPSPLRPPGGSVGGSSFRGLLGCLTGEVPAAGFTGAVVAFSLSEMR